MIYEALRVCHCIRKEPDEKIRQRMIAEVFVSGMFKRMVSNICSVKLGYQVLLWAIRFSKWRDKSLTPRRLAHVTLGLKD
ncbi:glycosyl transferase family protein [Escherichia coli]|nr:glycosyl transferase family protein [Escherichia coli]